LASILCLLIGIIIFTAVAIAQDPAVIGDKLRNITIDVMDDYLDNAESRRDIDWFQHEVSFHTRSILQFATFSVPMLR
jgi:hypothetical protein